MRQHPSHGVPGVWYRQSSLLSVLNLLQQWRVEFVEMLRNKVGVHLDVRKTLGMSGEMNLEISFGSKSVSTNIAFVRSFTGVRSKTNRKVEMMSSQTTLEKYQQYRTLLERLQTTKFSPDMNLQS